MCLCRATRPRAERIWKSTHFSSPHGDFAKSRAIVSRVIRRLVITPSQGDKTPLGNSALHGPLRALQKQRRRALHFGHLGKCRREKLADATQQIL